MPPPRQLQALLDSAAFLITCATGLSLAVVAMVALVLAIIVSALCTAKAVPLALVVALAAAAVYAVLDRRRVAATALQDVGHLLSGERQRPQPARAAVASSTEARPRSKRDMVRSLLDKVIDSAFESVALQVFGLPALSAFLAWVAHRGQHDLIAFLCTVVAILSALCGVVPYVALRYIVTKQLDSIMDAIPHAAPSSRETCVAPSSETTSLVAVEPSTAVSAAPATENSPLIK